MCPRSKQVSVSRGNQRQPEGNAGETQSKGREHKQKS